MSLFGFGDITFDKSPSGARGPLAPLVRSEFESNSYRYPIDLGNYDKAHYMVFYIREQKNSSYAQNAGLDDSLIDGATSGANNPELAGFKNLGGVPGLYSNLNNVVGKVNNLTGGAVSGLSSSSIGGAISGAVNSVVGGISNLFGSKSNILGGTNQATQAIIDTSVKKITGGSLLNNIRTTQLTKDSIALYMPDTLLFSHNQSYDQLNMGNELLGQVAAGAKSALDALEAGGAEQGYASLKKSALRTILAQGESVGQTVRGAITAVTGTVINPMIEMIYRSPNFRTFQFDFMFYPRDEKEARQVQLIIEKLKFHQAPELSDKAQGFLVAPSEFDIRFYYAGKQNPNIPPIATCVLTNINVNYAPNGFSTFEVPNENFPSVGRTGMPVAIELSLQFQETTFLTKSDYKNTNVSEASYGMSAAYSAAGQVNQSGEGIY